MKKAIGLYFAHENNVLRSCSEMYNISLAKLGYETMLLDLAAPDSATQLDSALASGEVDFCFGIQGVGSTLEAEDGKSLWTARRVPFICVHYDSPCHNPYNHFSNSRFVANLYFFESFLETKERYLPSDQLSAAVHFALPMQWSPAQFRVSDFESRPIRLLFMKSGGSLDEHTVYINALPPKVRDALWQQLGRAEKSPNLQLSDLVDEVFVALGMDRLTQERDFWGLVQTMDIYLRRKRAIDLINWLKFQEGALIIGNGWDFIDKAGACAKFQPAVDFAVADALPVRTQFFCNTNPYGRDIIHERVLTGLYTGCCVLSDTNAWWDKNFNLPALTLFDWECSLDDQLRPVLESAAVAEHAQAGPEAVYDRFIKDASAQPLIDLAQKTREFA